MALIKHLECLRKALIVTELLSGCYIYLVVLVVPELLFGCYTLSRS